MVSGNMTIHADSFGHQKTPTPMRTMVATGRRATSMLASRVSTMTQKHARAATPDTKEAADNSCQAVRRFIVAVILHSLPTAEPVTDSSGTVKTGHTCHISTTWTAGCAFRKSRTRGHSTGGETRPRRRRARRPPAPGMPTCAGQTRPQDTGRQTAAPACSTACTGPWFSCKLGPWLCHPHGQAPYIRTVTAMCSASNTAQPARAVPMPVAARLATSHHARHVRVPRMPRA